MSIQNKTNAQWALVNLDSASGPIPCVEVSGRCYNLEESMKRTGSTLGAGGIISLFDNWEASERLLDSIARQPDPSDEVADTRKLAPLLYPGKIMCAGANYFRHLEEMGVTGATKENQRLFFFMKAPRNAVVGEGDAVHMPLDTKAFDWEIELAAVIGKRARAVSPEQALNHVAGYTVAIDFSARDLNRAPETFYKLDWVSGKAQETCCPMGPRFIPASAVRDPQDLKLRLSVNGTIKQDDNTSDMIFPLDEQIATASRIMTLHPGDVILTGTPAGVGVPRQEFLKPGDRVDAEIENIGTLSVTIQPPLGT